MLCISLWLNRSFLDLHQLMILADSCTEASGLYRPKYKADGGSVKVKK